MATAHSPLASLLAEKPVAIADGAMGTNLFALGLSNGDCGEIWNVEHPDRVASIHRSMVEAGADILLTNTFGANRYRLQLHNAEDRMRELNMAGVAVAREAADGAGRPVIVAGSVGPTGDVLEPLGTRTFDEAVQAFTDQMQAMMDAGVDVIWIETIFANNELEAAVTAVQNVGAEFVSTMTFDTAGKTMMGLTPHDASRLVAGFSVKPIGFGANCGVGPAQMLDTLLGLKGGLGDNVAMVSKCNCGIPQMGTDLKIHYSGTPEIMADYACLARDAGARIVGGCCGTTAEHISAMATALSTRPQEQSPSISHIESVLGELNPVSAAPSTDTETPRRQRGGRRARRSA